MRMKTEIQFLRSKMKIGFQAYRNFLIFVVVVDTVLLPCLMENFLYFCLRSEVLTSLSLAP